MNSKILFLSLSIIFSSCGGSLFNSGPENLDLEDDFNKIEVADEFSIMLPKYLKQDSTLNEEAILAYQNAVKETATLVLEEYRSELEYAMPQLTGYSDTATFIANYIQVQTAIMSESLEFPEVGTPKYYQINGKPAAQTWMEGRIEDMDISYLITCIDGGSKAYVVLSYTTVSKKAKFENTFEKIANSLMLKNPVED